MKQLLQIAEEVREALEFGRPVVALETAIVSHGMPYPRNVQTAHALEQAVRENGAVPATIAVLDGTIRIGISSEELERLARGKDVLKLSRRDLSYALSADRDGSTTVAATMLCAKMAGITILATGGIGGVHRGAEHTFDVSADMIELARTPVAVVCAGAKALLDLPKTLEMLETFGIPVISYGTDKFPAFWSRDSGLRSPLRADTVQEVARIIRLQRALEMTSGIVIAQPISEAAEIPYEQMSEFIEKATAEASRQGIGGKDITPWVLKRINELSSGRSLEANVALVKANAALAATIANELCEIDSPVPLPPLR